MYFQISMRQQYVIQYCTHTLTRETGRYRYDYLSGKKRNSSHFLLQGETIFFSDRLFYWRRVKHTHTQIQIHRFNQILLSKEKK